MSMAVCPSIKVKDFSLDAFFMMPQNTFISLTEYWSKCTTMRLELPCAAQTRAQAHKHVNVRPDGTITRHHGSVGPRT